MNNPGVVPLDLGGRSSGVHDVFVGDQEALLYLGKSGNRNSEFL